ICDGIRARRFEPAAHAPPQIDFIAEIEWNGECVGGDVAETWVLIGRITLSRVTGIVVDCRHELTTSDASHGARLIHPRDGSLQVLVRATGLALESVENFIAENFPPRSLRNSVERLAGFPNAELLDGFVAGRNGIRRTNVIGTHFR